VSNKLREEIFGNFQDRAFLQEVVAACRDAYLWQFIVLVGAHVMDPLEHVRRWGMTCAHAACKKLRDDGAKHVTCIMNSRKLHMAWDFIQKEVHALRQKAVDLNVDMREGSNTMLKLVRAMMFTAADNLLQRYKHLDVVPWCLWECETVEGAKKIIAQIRARPLSDHDIVTKRFWAVFEGDVVRRANGGELSPALRAEIKAIKNSPLDESIGEGFHRSTNHEHVRAPSATSAHLKRTVRIKGLINFIRKFCSTYGRRGRDVFRFEWKNCTRVLQTNLKHRWRPRRMTQKAAVARLYREDKRADEDWASICKPCSLERPVEVEPCTNRQQLEKEYLAAVLVRQQYYAVERVVPGVGEDGQPTERTEPVYFQLLAAVESKNRENKLCTRFSLPTML